MLKIGFIGAGWRAHGYIRVIQEFRHRMVVSGILAHSQERALELEKEFPGKVDTDLEDFMGRDHDFVMVLVPRKDVLHFIEELAKKGIPVLSETPPGDGIAELNRCYEVKEKYGAKIQVAEQYFLRPYYQGIFRMIREGRIGKISSMEIAMIHDYHAMSIMRRTFGITYENCVVDAKGYSFPVHYHCGREGLHGEQPGNLVMNKRKRAEFAFENGQVGFYDFSDQQYFNYFRTRHLNIRGDLGEIWDYDMAFLGKDGLPVRGKILRDELGRYENLEGYGLRGLVCNGEILYDNPYIREDVRLSDDEIAMAGLLDGMGRYVHGGEEIYPLEEALQDTYLYLTMDESIRQGMALKTTTQTWAK